VAMATAAFASETSVAATYQYCTGNVNGFDHCDSIVYGDLYKNTVYNSQGAGYRVCAGAWNFNTGGFVGSYVCNPGSAFHYYNLPNNYAGRLHNGESFVQAMYGQVTHN
jgi:hypothetical protein